MAKKKEAQAFSYDTCVRESVKQCYASSPSHISSFTMVTVKLAPSRYMTRLLLDYEPCVCASCILLLLILYLPLLNSLFFSFFFVGQPF